MSFVLGFIRNKELSRDHYYIMSMRKTAICLQILCAGLLKIVITLCQTKGQLGSPVLSPAVVNSGCPQQGR